MLTLHLTPDALRICGVRLSKHGNRTTQRHFAVSSGSGRQTHHWYLVFVLFPPCGSSHKEVVAFETALIASCARLGSNKFTTTFLCYGFGYRSGGKWKANGSQTGMPRWTRCRTICGTLWISWDWFGLSSETCGSCKIRGEFVLMQNSGVSTCSGVFECGPIFLSCFRHSVPCLLSALSSHVYEAFMRRSFYPFLAKWCIVLFLAFTFSSC